MSGPIATPREDLGEWMRVERTGADVYATVLQDHFGAAHRGDLLARCALAALAASSGGVVTALHADWLAAAKPDMPIALRVTPQGAGGRYEVLGTAAAPVCRVSASVGAPSGTQSYQDAALPPGLPHPESLPATVEYARKEGWPEAYAAGPVEFRRIGPLKPDRARGESSEQVSWLKLRAPLPHDAGIEQAALVFLATFYDHWEFERRLGEHFDYPSLSLCSHALWLHRPLRPDAWLLLRATSRVAAAGRALGMRELFAADGALLATVVSEAHVG
jgi:acyl-CoA thioesterase-2